MNVTADGRPAVEKPGFGLVYPRTVYPPPSGSAGSTGTVTWKKS